MPDRPTREFWAKVYPDVLRGYLKKYPRAEAEQRARKATADIWYRKVSPTVKARYEKKRRKREHSRHKRKQSNPWKVFRF